MDNSQDALKQWVNEALEGCDVLDDREKYTARRIARNIIMNGGFRGDISDAWKRQFDHLNQANMPELYP